MNFLIGFYPGSGGGTLLNKSDNSATDEASAHCAIPVFHTRDSRFSVPDCVICASCSALKGPVCWPLEATKNCTAPGIGGGVVLAVG